MTRELRHVLEAILAGVLVVDRQGRVEELNSAACRMLGVSGEALVGEPLERLAEPEHALVRLGRAVLASGISASEARQPLPRPGEEALSVDVAASPLFDAAGEASGAVLVLRDRAANQRLEQLEAERQRFADFGRIAAGLAHEIKNPLGGIRGAGELLAQRAEGSKTQEAAELIVREATRIAGLVDEFMVFARGEALRLAPVNIHRVLDDVLGLVSLDPLAADATLERVYDPSIPELLADADRLTQVFLNLLHNALQAIEGQPGVLTVTTRMSLDHRIAVGSGRPLPTLTILVTDTGRGMEPETLAQARTPFFTTRAGGTGLGLAVADYWVSQHLGSLALESEKGRGTTARVTLPLRREP